MNLKLRNRITGVLKTGSINRPGQNACNILASKLGAKEKNVRTELNAMKAEGLVTFEYGFIALSDRPQGFRPETPEGWRQQAFAVDQRGMPYSGTTTGGPVTARNCTLEEWVRFGNDPSTYPHAVEEPAAQEEEPKMPRKKPARRVNTAPQLQKRAKMDQLKQLIVEACEAAENGLVLNEQFKNYASVLLGIPLTTIGSYMNEFRKEKFLEFVTLEWQGKQHLKLLPKQDYRTKLNSVLVLLRSLMTQTDRRPIREEVATLFGTSKENADVHYLRPLRKIGAYRTERVGSNLFQFRLYFVQEGELSDEQFEEIIKLKREARLSKGKDSQVVAELPSSGNSAPQADQPLGALDGTPDLEELIAGLLRKIDEQTAYIEHLEESNARLILRSEALETSLQAAGMRAAALEAEIATKTAMATPSISQDLLQRARDLAK